MIYRQESTNRIRLLAVLALTLVVVSKAHAETAKPNIVLILCDNLGYGDIEPFWSGTPHRTPNLNRMAKEGRKFTHFYVTAGVCTPSRASILTGCYAQRVGMHKIPVDDHVLRPVSPYGLNPEEVTVAEILKQSGYATTLIGKWHLGDQPPFLPTRQGFDSYFGIPYSDDMTAREWKGRTWPALPLMQNEVVIEAPADRDTLTKRYTERAIKFITDNKATPFFLFLSHAMPGSTRTPYASKQFQGHSTNGRWGDSVQEIDWSTGEILNTLKRLAIDKNTLVVWTSDNGAPNLPNSIARGTNRPLFGRGYTTTEGGMRVPTIVWWPGKVPAASECTELATTMDLLPTFAAMAGGSTPTDRVIDGHDIRPLLFDAPNAKSAYDAFFYFQGDQLQAVRAGTLKYFLPLEKPHRHGRFRKGPTSPLLFDLTKGTTNLLDQPTADTKRSVAKLQQLAAEFEASLSTRGSRRERGKVTKPMALTVPNERLNQ